MEDSCLDVEVCKAGNNKVIEPFDLSDPIDVECMYSFVENKQQVAEYFYVVS